MSFCYPEGNFGRNQLLDGSISLSPLYPNLMIDLHLRITMSVASPGHFSILSTPLQTHHMTNYLTNHLTWAPDSVPPDLGAHDHSHDPVTKYLTSTLDKTRDQACDSSHDIM